MDPTAPSGAPLRSASRLVAREEELNIFHAALDESIRTGGPTFVTTVGAPGMGKKSLLRAWATDAKTTSRATVVVVETPDSVEALAIVSDYLRARLDLGSGEISPDQFREALGEILNEQTDTFAETLSVFVGADETESAFVNALGPSASETTNIRHAMLRRFLEIDAQTRPLAIAFTDLHHLTDDALELLAAMVRTLRGAPVVMVFSTRPELLTRQSDWFESLPHMERLDLGPLDVNGTRAFLGNRYPTESPLPDQLVAAAQHMSAGVPYLIEQVVRSFERTGVLVQAPQSDTWRVDVERLSGATLPLSVDDAIQARLGALGRAERQFLEMGAAVGSHFWLGAVLVVERQQQHVPELWGGNDSRADHLSQIAAHLVQRGYLKEVTSSMAGEAQYAFRHALEMDALVRLTDRHAARRYHHAIAEWFETRLFERGEAQYELLAFHFDEGGTPERAARYYLLAADRARDRFANAKAVQSYARGLELLGDGHVAMRVEALHHFGDVLQRMGRNDEARNAFEKLLALAFAFDLRPKGGVAHNRIGRLHRSLGQLDAAMRHLGTAMALFDGVGDERGVASSLDDIGKVHWMRGDYHAAERFFTDALKRRESLGDLRSVGLSLNNLGVVAQDSGRTDAAMRFFNNALATREEANDPEGISQTLNNLGTIHQDVSEHVLAKEYFERAYEGASMVGDRMRQAVIQTNLAESERLMGNHAEALRTLTAAKELSSSLGDIILEGEVLRGLAQVHLSTGDHASAAELIEQALVQLEPARGKPYLGAAHRTAGQVHATHDLRLAVHHFDSAVEIFETLGNRNELIMTLQALARVLDASGGEIHVERASDLRKRIAELAGPFSGESTVVTSDNE